MHTETEPHKSNCLWVVLATFLVFAILSALETRGVILEVIHATFEVVAWCLVVAVIVVYGCLWFLFLGQLRHREGNQ